MSGSRPPLQSHRLRDDGTYPNSRLPLVALPGAFPGGGEGLARRMETTFGAHGWVGSWRNGVYPFHHYHSTAHEVLGVFQGRASLLLGGERGVELTVAAGDVLVVPAGVAHRNLGASPDFAVVGAYPRGQAPDLLTGRPGERPAADGRIIRLGLPEQDPVHGAGGPLLGLWSAAGAKPDPA